MIVIPKPHVGQKKLIGTVKTHRRHLWLLGRRFGKTSLAVILLLENALTRPHYRVAWSAPNFKQIYPIWDQVVSTLKPVCSRISVSERRLVLLNGSTLDFYSGDNPDAGRGRKFDIWIADELQMQLNLSHFLYSTIFPTLIDNAGSFFGLATPNGVGSDLHKLYSKWTEDKDVWSVQTGTSYDNPLLDPKEIAQTERGMPPTYAAQELYAKWVRSGGILPLVGIEQWDSMYEEYSRPNSTETIYLGLDASVSHDCTALVGVRWVKDTLVTDRDFIYIWEPTKEKNTDFELVRQTILDLWQKYPNIRLSYDPYQLESIGQGLRKSGMHAQPFNQSSQRNLSDSYLRTILQAGKYRHPQHEILNQHILAAKTSSIGEKFRIIKQDRSEENRNDAAIALSMATYKAYTTRNANSPTQTIAVGSIIPNLSQPNPFSAGNSPLGNLSDIWKR